MCCVRLFGGGKRDDELTGADEWENDATDVRRRPGRRGVARGRVYRSAAPLILILCGSTICHEKGKGKHFSVSHREWKHGPFSHHEYQSCLVCFSGIINHVWSNLEEVHRYDLTEQAEVACPLFDISLTSLFTKNGKFPYLRQGRETENAIEDYSKCLGEQASIWVVAEERKVVAQTEEMLRKARQKIMWKIRSARSKVSPKNYRSRSNLTGSAPFPFHNYLST
jgi:hypothetical protein